MNPTAKHTRLTAILDDLPYDRLTPLTGIFDREVALRLYPNRFCGHPVPHWGTMRADILELYRAGLISYVDNPCGPVTAKGRSIVRFYYRTGDPGGDGEAMHDL